MAFFLGACSGGPTDLVPAPGALAPLASAPPDESREYPNINVAPGAPDGETLNPEQRVLAGEQLRSQGAAAEAQAPNEARIEAGAREIAARRQEVERRREADRALLCENREGGDRPPSCED